MEYGPVAQLGARFNRTEEVEGSNPSRSIREEVPIAHEVPFPGELGAPGIQLKKSNQGPIAHEVPFPGELGAPWDKIEKE